MRRSGHEFVTVVMFTMLIISCIGGIAKAEDGLEEITTAIDTIWTLIAASLVFLMQAGFAMVEAGFTRAKNAANIVMKNLMDFAIGSLSFWIVGFAIMFGAGTVLYGTGRLFTLGDYSGLGLSIPLSAFLLFQTVFAATAATIVSGAMAERTKYTSYLIYSAVITAFIYPVFGHWAWGGGWLSDMGFIDFAGSSVVHSVGGWAALIGAKIIGPRIGRYRRGGLPNAIPGHNLVIAALGVFILWFGWFGFNPGSTVSGMDPSIADIAVATNLAAAAGAIAAMVASWLRFGKADVSMTMNGVLAGLVGITAGCASVSPVGAVLIGLGSGVVVVIAIGLFEKVGIDDPVGAISVHGVCGAFGTLAVGLLAVDGGLCYGGGFRQLGVQLTGVLSCLVWTAVTAWILFVAIEKTVGLRVSPQEEIEGLDIHEHGGWAYPSESLESALDLENARGI